MWTDVSEESITSIMPSHLLQASFLVGWFSTLNMEVMCSSETSVHMQTTSAISQKTATTITNPQVFYRCWMDCMRVEARPRRYAAQLWSENAEFSEYTTSAIVSTVLGAHFHYYAIAFALAAFTTFIFVECQGSRREVWEKFNECTV
jgi:hypothetical protein